PRSRAGPRLRADDRLLPQSDSLSAVGAVRVDLRVESGDTAGWFIPQRHARLPVTFRVVHRISVGRGGERARFRSAGLPARRGDSGRLRLTGWQMTDGGWRGAAPRFPPSAIRHLPSIF